MYGKKCLMVSNNNYSLQFVLISELNSKDLAFLPLADIRNWIRNIEQHASDNVNKVLIGNKADMDESKRVCLNLNLGTNLLYSS